MKTFNKAFYFPLLFLFLYTTTTFAAVDCFVEDSSTGTKTFKQHCLPNENGTTVEALNIRGGIYQIGNQIICAMNNSNMGTCIDPGTNQNNTYGTNTSAGAANFLGNADYDSNLTTINSSKAGLTLKTDDNILWARLQWIGQMDEDNGANDLTSSARTVKFKTPTSIGYQNIECDFYGTHTYYHDNVNKMTYKCSAEVTSLVQESGDYWVADVDSELGLSNNFASWGLTMVYSNPIDDAVNVTLFEGYRYFWDDDAYFQINGFLTPLENEVEAKLFLFAGEGDYGYVDYLRISNANNLTFTSNTDSDQHGGEYTKVLNPMNGSTNDFCNGSISTYGANVTDRDPNYSNALGTDVDSVDIVDENSTQILGNRQTSTTLHFHADELLTMSILGTQIKLHVPEFCYDYAYKQQGKYFTETNDGNTTPRIVGSVVENTDVNVTIFLRNLVDSDISIEDMSVDILDINTTQATYIRETTALAKVPEIFPTHIPDADLTVSDSYIKGIEIADMKSNDYFYVYYGLNPNEDTLDMPLNAVANYTLNIDGINIPYSLRLGHDMRMCSNSNYDYEPVEGQFNLVHDNYYTWNGSTGTKYYNLPTQITSREGNFKVISMDPENMNNLKDVPSMTPVAIELIDVSAFHDTFTACKELESAISPRIWVDFDANTSSVSFDQAALIAASNRENLIASEGSTISLLPNSYDFYKEANENTAFRISYITDVNDTGILNYTETATGIKINNFVEVVQTVGKCSQKVWWDKATGSGLHHATTVAGACGSVGNEITKEHLHACLECIYGTQTQLVCSRDNFSIRPEAILIKLKDQNQTNSATKQKIGDDISGVANANETAILAMAAGYQYYLEANATNHQSNAASPGYTKTYGITNDDKYLYAWDSNNSACNDEVDKQLDIRYLEGKADLNTSVDQIGLYKLNQTDKEWTTVDNDINYMQHHNDSTYFLFNGSNPDLDCKEDSTITRAVNDSNLNGCDISSNHDNNNANLEYRDYSIMFYSYKFDLSDIKETIGLTHTEVNTTTAPFVYMSDMSTSSVDENMSFHLNGKIEAQGYNDILLTNFVDGCYAEALEIDLNVTTMKLPVAYQFRFHSLATDKTDINTHNGDLNNTGNVINLVTADFPKTNLGAADTILNLNYNRTNSFEVNPEQVIFNNYNVDCTTLTNCEFNADLMTNKASEGRETLSSTAVTYYYGRTNAPRNRFVGPGPHNAFIYYEVYCSGTTAGGSTCNKALLQNRQDGLSGLNSRITDDPRWFRNEAHIVASHGNAGVDNTQITQKNAANVSTGTLINATGRTTAPLTYNENRGYPYKATMENNASRFLIYDKYDTTNTNIRNEFEVEFVSGTSNWAGKAASTGKTDEVGSKKTNRRSMW